MSIKLFVKEVLKLNNKPHVEKKIIKAFLKRIQSDPSHTKEQNIYDHLCAFFLPVNKKTKTIYLGHHIKADDWIPPGGHIKFGEMPLHTVRREFVEELKHTLTNEPIELFDLSIKDVSGNPRHKCKIHYDFWYLVFIDKKDFNFDKSEFYQAGWFTLKEGIKKMKLEQYNQIVKKLGYRL